MTLANRNRLAARLPADYADFGYAPIFADDMNALAGVAVDVELQKLSAALSDDQTAANRVQTGLFRTAAASAGSSAATGVAVPLDQSVGERANDTSVWTMVRSTPCWGFGISGALEETAIDTIRWEFDPATLAPFGLDFAGARSNSVRNPWVEGGTVGSPGTYPTNWSINANGMTSQVVALSNISGRGYMDVKLTETTSSGSQTQIYFDSTVVASSGQTWASSFQVAIVGGTLKGVAGIFSRVDVAGGTGTGFGAAAALSSTLTFAPAAIVTCGSGASSVRPSLQINRIAGLDIDITLRIALPKLELGPFLSAPIMPVVASPAVSSRTQGTVSIPVKELGSRYNYRQGILIVDWNSQPGPFTSAADTNYFGIVSLGDLGANEVMGLLVNPAHTAALFRRTVGGAPKTTATLTITPPAAGETVRFAMAWDIDAQLMQVAARGAFSAQVTGVNASEIPIITHLMPGRFSTTRPLYGRINGLEIRPAAVWGASLSALT